MKLELTGGQFGGGIFAAAALAAVALAAPTAARTQYGGMGGQQPQQQEQKPTLQPNSAQQNPPPAEAPKDPEEEKAFKAFYDTGVTEPEKEIQLGEPFLQKYPQSRYAEQVYSRLAQAYYNKQNLDKMYEDGEKAIALNPDDVTVLTLIGWVIPHQPQVPDFEARLKKAEGYEKHAIEKLNTMEKPAAMTDAQFANAKKEGLSQAHSGLGLVYFREDKPTEAASELKLAVESSTSPDPTDYYVMGVELQKLDRSGEAADAFQKCAQTPGALQSRCKQNSEDAKKKASQPAKP